MDNNFGKKGIIYFDLGDTLIYRERPSVEFDIEAIETVTGIQKKYLEEFDESLENLYFPVLEANKCASLKDEEIKVRNVFESILANFGQKEKLKQVLDIRSKQKRYKLFTDVEKYLKKSKNMYHLGIITNGRPSRRIILQQLGIDKYFEPNLIFISDEIGISKPDDKIKDIVRKKEFGDKIILVDDEIDNIKMAQSFGWRGIQLKRAGGIGLELLDQFI